MLEKNNAGPRFPFRLIGKLIASALAAAMFAFGHGRLMTSIRSAPEAFFAESSSALAEKTGRCSASGGLSVLVSSSADETLCSDSVDYKLFGLITVKRIPAHIGKRPELCPGGCAVGISIHTEGVLVVGVESFKGSGGRKESPAADAGIMPGDVIASVNGSGVNTARQLQSALDINEGVLQLELIRDGRHIFTEVRPAYSEDGIKRIGAWVRDSTVGIGTLSFYEAETGIAAALGHAVIDADTGSLLTVKDGKLVSAVIIGVTKGRQGAPGELHGTFGDSSPELGRITLNTELGIYGVLQATACEELNDETLQTAFPDEVRTGDAVIICSADGSPKAYGCRIIKTCRQDRPEPKGLVIEITDEKLIELTGGIVQGMSGSPVIQDGQLVGVITHVFVNDPLRGYGAYAYWMYKRYGG